MIPLLGELKPMVPPHVIVETVSLGVALDGSLGTTWYKVKRKGGIQECPSIGIDTADTDSPQMSETNKVLLLKPQEPKDSFPKKQQQKNKTPLIQSIQRLTGS